MRFACSMSRSIDPRRPWKLTTQQSRSVNDYPCIVKLQRRADRFYGAPKGSQRERKHKRAVQQLRNEKKRQRDLLQRDIIERYSKEQPVIVSERQLSGKVVDEEVRSALEHPDKITENGRRFAFQFCMPCLFKVRLMVDLEQARWQAVLICLYWI
jgi:Protein of unknown function (DUF3435)